MRGRGLGLVLLGLLAVPAARAQDPENCLLCHRFRGLSRLDPQTNELRLFFTEPSYYLHRAGPHARLRCTDCHRRDEVQRIPHAVQTPVDCTTTCHIAPATGTELRFSHQRVADSLQHSVHAPERIAELRFELPLLRPGQATCLYCHDEPTFGFAEGLPEGFRTPRGGTRCDTCHREELPLDVRYFAQHVAARMQPERTLRQLAQVCAVCHSDPALVQQMDSHDTVASYLHSFHGKAALLGSTETARCVDCHASGLGDQHLMLPKTVAESSISPEELPDTCRTVQCHPGYPPGMSSAAVHLELDPDAYPVEFVVASFFILLTAGVMLVFFLLIVLELVNAALRRPDPEHHRLVQLARLLLDHPEGRALVQRMSIHQRFQHWGLVITFVALVVTGMPIKFADAGWAERLVGLLGGLTAARWIHRIAGAGLIAVFVYHLGYLIGKLVQRRRAERQAGGVPAPLWRVILNSPMVINLRDLREAGQHIAFLLGRRKQRPHFGRFTYTQKFEYWAVFWGVPIMGFSGLALWGMPVVSGWLSGRAMNFAFIIHSDEAYLAFIYIATVHLFGVIFAPVVFPLSLGTLTGHAPAVELAEAHRGELEHVARELGVMLPPHHDPAHPTRGERLRAALATLVRRAYSVGLTGAYVVLAFVSLRFLVTMLLGHQAAPVEIVNIPKRLDADQFMAAAVRPVAAVDPDERPRGPLAHFHQIPQWFQPDPQNSCLTSGCHTLLPHGKRIEVRAFLNMHSTFADCMLCHQKGEHARGQAGWFSLPERQSRGTPPLLRLAGRLDELATLEPEEAPAVNQELIDLLQRALPAAGENAQLAHWLVRLQTTNPQSRVWQRLIEEMRTNIQAHVHGEYGARIGLFAMEAEARGGGAHPLGTPTAEQRQAIERYLELKRAGRLDNAEKTRIHDLLHRDVAPVGAMCTPCHAPQPTLIDLPKLGYPPRRIRALEENPVMRSILAIERGEPFQLPLAEAPQ
ncbi:MAG: cytochrome b/b6 domain-containing protein [Planctomycetota bacterium]